MNYYEYLLPNTNLAQRALKRVFLLIALFHFLSGLAFGILAMCINWRFVFGPLAWFLLGFVYGNIAYIFVTDYKYVYDNGVFSVFKHRRYGRYRLVVAAPVGDMDFAEYAMYFRQKHSTNCPANLSFIYDDIRYIVTVDDYMMALVKSTGAIGDASGATVDAAVAAESEPIIESQNDETAETTCDQPNEDAKKDGIGVPTDDIS